MQAQLTSDGQLQISFGAAVEVANLPSSAVTKFGCFLLSVALAQLAKGDAATTANSFVKQLFEIQGIAALRAYGIKPAWVNVNPTITAGFIVDIKKGIAKAIANDPTVSADELKFVKFASLFVADPAKSPAYIDRARKFAVTVSSAFLRNFEKVVDKINANGGATKTSNKANVSDIYTQLDDVMSSILGRALKKGEVSIPYQDLKKYTMKSTKLADLVKQYKSFRRQLSLNYDLDFAKFIATKKDLVPVSEAYKYMKSIGYRDHKILETEKSIPLKVGINNGKVKYYTDSGKPLLTGIPANAIDVKFARTYDEASGTGAYLSYTTPDALGITRVYTEMHSNKATENKFNTASKVGESIDSVVARWKKDLTNPDMLTQMAATACMLVYLTGMRVGSRQTTAASATGEKTFGAISLRPRHIKVSPTSIILKYSGKKAVEQKHIIKVNDTSTKRVAQNLAAYIKGKKGDTLVFSFVNDRGTDKVLTYAALTKYLTTSGYPAGIHKIRHVRGTNLVLQMLKENQWKPTAKAATNLTIRQKEGEAYIINKIITPVTELLGHKSGKGALLWRTTIKSYINPQPILQWFIDHDLRKPSWLPTKLTEE